MSGHRKSTSYVNEVETLQHLLHSGKGNAAAQQKNFKSFEHGHALVKPLQGRKGLQGKRGK